MLNIVIISIILAVTAFMGDIRIWNGTGDIENKTISGNSPSSNTKLSEYSKSISGYNQIGGYKATLKFSNSNVGTIEFYEKIPATVSITFVPVGGVDFATSLVAGVNTLTSTLSEYQINPSSFDDTRSQGSNRKMSLTITEPKKLEFSGFSKNDTVFISFGSYVRYKVVGEFENAHDNALSDDSVLDSNGFINAITDQTNVNGAFTTKN